MKRWASAIAVGLLLGSAQMALADFTVSYLKDPNPPDANHQRFEFFAKNDGGHGSGQKLLAEDIELVSDQKMVVGSLSNGDADVSGTGASDFFNSDRSYINILGNPGDPENTYRDPSNPTEPTFAVVFTQPKFNQQAQWVGGSSDFRVVGAHLHNVPGILANGTVNGGRGALIATAIVPNNATYIEMIPWGLGGETGPAFGDFLGHADPPPQIGHLDPSGFNQLNALSIAVPEPAVLGLVGMVMSCLLRRRRRTI
jgi:hypothetical protein